MVEQRLVRRLLRNARATLWLGLVVGVVVGYALYRSSGEEGLLYWIGALALVSGTRLATLPALKRRMGHEQYRLSGLLYACGAFAGGLVWAHLILFDFAQQPLAGRLLLLTVLVCMPVASLSSNAIYIPVFHAFSFPIYMALLAWTIWFSPGLSLEFGVMAGAYSVLTTTLAQRYNQTLAQTIQRDLENERLLHELERVNGELHRIAYQDPLTGLSNRRSFEEDATKLLGRLGHNEKLALMLIDMDNFKQINDSLGHAAGDQALVTLARRIDENSRVSEIVAQNLLSSARIGGDEFIVIYRLDPDSPVEPLAGRIVAAAAEPMVVGDRTYNPSVSIGIALTTDHATTLDDLLRRADMAMYRAKAEGGGCFIVATESAPVEAAQSEARPTSSP